MIWREVYFMIFYSRPDLGKVSRFPISQYSFELKLFLMTGSALQGCSASLMIPSRPLTHGGSPETGLDLKHRKYANLCLVLFTDYYLKYLTHVRHRKCVNLRAV